MTATTTTATKCPIDILIDQLQAACTEGGFSLAVRAEGGGSAICAVITNPKCSRNMRLAALACWPKL